MKKLLTAFLMASCMSVLFAREPVPDAVTYGDPDTSEIFHILRNLGYDCFRLRLPVDSTQSYNVEMILEEYEQRELVDENAVRFSPTYRQILYGESDEIVIQSYDQVSVIFDYGTTSEYNRVMFLIPGSMAGGLPITIREECVKYATRPFAVRQMVPGEKIPVALLGAFWHDEKYDIYRFCGRKELDLDIEEDIFDLSPHYFIVYLRLTENHDGVMDLRNGQ